MGIAATEMKQETTNTCAKARRVTGQEMTEYIIIVALIAIASIVAVSFFGSSVKASFLSLGSDLVGGTAVNRADLVQDNFKAAEDKAKAKVTLKDYNN